MSRNKEFWQDKLRFAEDKIRALTYRIEELDFHINRHEPKRRLKGTKVKFLGVHGQPYYRNVRRWKYRYHLKWQMARNGWLTLVNQRAKMKHKIEMLRTTKIPYYQEMLQRL